MFLNQNSSISSNTIPKYEAHLMFVADVDTETCNRVQMLPYKERCNYVLQTNSCSEFVDFFNYVEYLYCSINPQNLGVHILGLLSVFLICMYMFVILGTTADKFFCPALTMLSKLLHMSESLAGVTLLAFGNGSPDLFTSLADTEGDTELMYSELFGAAAFITGIVAATIIIVKPFPLIAEDFIRDTAFFIFAVSYVDFVTQNGAMSYLESIGTICVYISYLTVVIIDEIFISYTAKKAAKKFKMLAQGKQAKLLTALDSLKKQKALDSKEEEAGPSLGPQTQKSVNFITFGSNENLFSQFLESLNPIDKEDWNEPGAFSKFMCIIKIPIILILTLVIPIVDNEREAHGWSKLINCWHVIALPNFIILIKKWYEIEWYNITILVYVNAGTFLLALLVFFTSRTDRPPKYHFMFCLAAIIGSITVISTFASEVVNILNLVGIASMMSASFLGATILAWGNSVGDLISNITIARQGYQRMAFAACFGGPLFNSLLGIGLSLLIRCINSVDGEATVRQGAMGANCTTFLQLILGFTVAAVALLSFQTRRSTGYFILCIYVLFLVFTILGELEIVHPYGTDHLLE